MTYRLREDGRLHISDSSTVEKPRLDWLLLLVLTADLGVWVGLLAWWIWR